MNCIFCNKLMYSIKWENTHHNCRDCLTSHETNYYVIYNKEHIQTEIIKVDDVTLQIQNCKSKILINDILSFTIDCPIKYSTSHEIFKAKLKNYIIFS